MGTQVPAKPSATALGGLLASAFALALLALYQWMELLVLEAGGALSCSVNATLDCGPVWSSPAAKTIASIAKMPVAGLGLVWGLAASMAAGVLAVRTATDRGPGPWIAAARWIALAGVLTSLGLGSVSLQLGVWCPTCMLTYALTLVFAFAAVKLPGPIRAEGLGAGLGWAIGAAAASYLALLGPAVQSAKNADASGKKALEKVLKTPPSAVASPAASASASPAASAVASAVASPAASPVVSPAASPAASATPAASPVASAPATPAPAQAGGEIGELIGALPPRGRQMLADVLLEYSMSPTKVRPAADKPRFVHGPASAPVMMTEWTDVMCGHCAEFVTTLAEVKARLPAGSVRVEPRQFPLDQECNPTMKHSDGTGTRCSAARALVCLEGSAAFFDAQLAMFKEQNSLNKERVVEIARSYAFDRRAFDACLASPDTNKKIQADVSAAIAADLHGTPHVIMNGKISPPFGPFLYVFLANGGRLDHPALAMLPKGQPPQPHDHAH